MNPSLEHYWKGNDRQYWLKAADALGITLPDSTVYEHTLSGLVAYMAAAGVQYFSAEEVARPFRKWPALLLPPTYAWIGIAVLGTIADRLRELVGRPVKLRNWWRPEDYNEMVKGAEYSDHLWACAIDLDFTGMWWTAVFARRKAQRWLRSTFGGILIRQDVNGKPLIPAIYYSLGIGWRTLHVGLFAPRTLKVGRHRRWKYGKLPSTEKYI